jgi:hypothetical protein
MDPSEPSFGPHFTSFTSTKVRILTRLRRRTSNSVLSLLTLFVTSTKVQILTHMCRQRGATLDAGERLAQMQRRVRHNSSNLQQHRGGGDCYVELVQELVE